MGCFSGPEIVNNGLVFHYDMNNSVKSWKGKPTTNNSDIAWHTQWANSGAGVWNHDDTTIEKVFFDAVVQSFEVSNTGNIHLGIGTGTITAATYTASCYIYIPSSAGTLVGSVPYFRSYPANSNRGALAYNGNTDWNTWPRDTWLRIEVSWNNTAGDTSAYISCYLNTLGNKVYLHAPQLELSDFATPWVNGTRSNNEAILDLSGQGNTITADSLTYNNDGSFGIAPNGELIVPHSATLHPTDAYTSEVWLWADSSQDNLYPRVWDKSSILVHLSQTSPFTIAQNTSTSAGLRQVSIGGAFAHSTWTHITTSYNGQVGKIYVNGSEIATTDWGSVLAPSANSTSLGIGGASTSTNRQFNGKISTFRFYNRALTANEVKQNFENTRGKYGV